jgi:hypothetical protein
MYKWTIMEFVISSSSFAFCSEDSVVASLHTIPQRRLYLGFLYL